MCGICGYFNWNSEIVLDRMLAQMVHRGPDEDGRYIAPGIGLGVRRLSIIDPEGGHQPAVNETGSVRVVLNGEIYNHPQLRDELTAKGHVFTTRSDTEVIAHLYEEHGAEMVHRLRGMFAIAIWDTNSRNLLLIRDRLGIKPLYYVERHHGLGFASELGALRAALPDLSIRPSAIADYLALLYIPAPDTIFENVRHLPAGSMLTLNSAGMTITRYFELQPPPTGSSSSSLQDSKTQFRSILQDTVRTHLVSDVPVGLFLSGGLDSASILAMMRSVSNGTIRTFSIGYAADADRGFNEVNAAREMAARFGAEHTEELVEPDAASLLPQIVAAMGEPFADSSCIPTYLVSEIAGRTLKVAMAGIGGDELFGGYPRYLGMRAAMGYGNLPASIRRLLARGIAPLLPEHGGHRDHSSRVRRFLASGALPLDQQYLDWITFLPSEWTGDVMSTDLQAHARTTVETYKAMFTEWRSQSAPDKAAALDVQTCLPDDLLRMGDRLSMAHSLELRVPFCDHELLSFAMGISATTRMQGWKLKGFMRDSLRPVLPKETIDRPKLGFMVPLARWLREDLAEMVGDLLADDMVKKRGYVNPAYVQWIRAEHATGRRNFADQIFALLMLELWLRQFESR